MATTFEASGFEGDLFDGGGAPLTDHRSERELIGYLINKPGAVTETIEIVQARDLHDNFNKRLYELLVDSYEHGTEPSMGLLAEQIGGGEPATEYIAKLAAEADMTVDPGEVAEHLFALSERRAVGSADDTEINPSGAPFTSKFGGFRWEDIGATHGSPGYLWLVEDIVPMSEITLVYGDSGTGKTFDMFDLSMCVCRGLKFNGFNVESGLVVYVAAEAGRGFRKRKIAYTIHHKLEPSDPLPFFLLTKRPDLFHSDDDVNALIDEINAIKRQYRQKLVLIVVDTVSAVSPGFNENTSQDVSMIRKRLVMLQEQFSAAIVAIHHKPKGGNGPRGHGSFTADFETTIEFQTLEDRRTDTGRIIHRAIVRKQREGKKGATWEFTLPVVEVGKNKWGNPETSCVVLPYNPGVKAPKGFRPTPTDLEFMRALFDAIVDHGEPPPAGLPVEITKVVNYVYVRALMKQRMIPEDDEQASQRFRVAYLRAARRLRDGAVIGVQGNYFWYTGKPVDGLSGPAIDGG